MTNLRLVTCKLTDKFSVEQESLESELEMTRFLWQELFATLQNPGASLLPGES